MKTIIVLTAMLLIGISAQAQYSVKKDSAAIDSLLQRVTQLEKNQAIITNNIRTSGKSLYTGIGLIGGGIIVSTAGAVLLALARPTTTTTGGRTRTALSNLQIAGIAIGTAGLGVSIAGFAKVGEAGKTMKDL